MTPTMKLRFVERGTDYWAGRTEHGDKVELRIRVLQQWWEEFEEHIYVGGEWRDVPFEVEE